MPHGKALTAVAIFCLLAAGACASRGTPRPAPSHGVVVGHLAIPFRPTPATGKADIVRVDVTVGERFSIKVDTSDGPYIWDQMGTRPDPRLVRMAGDFNDGSCAPDMAGCRVPYFHTLVARGQGTTTMSWWYHDYACTGPRLVRMRAHCPAVTMVTFDITVT